MKEEELHSQTETLEDVSSEDLYNITCSDKGIKRGSASHLNVTDIVEENHVKLHITLSMTNTKQKKYSTVDGGSTVQTTVDSQRTLISVKLPSNQSDCIHNIHCLQAAVRTQQLACTQDCQSLASGCLIVTWTDDRRIRSEK